MISKIDPSATSVTLGSTHGRLVTVPIRGEGRYIHALASGGRCVLVRSDEDPGYRLRVCDTVAGRGRGRGRIDCYGGAEVVIAGIFADSGGWIPEAQQAIVRVPERGAVRVVPLRCSDRFRDTDIYVRLGGGHFYEGRLEGLYARPPEGRRLLQEIGPAWLAYSCERSLALDEGRIVTPEDQLARLRAVVAAYLCGEADEAALRAVLSSRAKIAPLADVRSFQLEGWAPVALPVLEYLLPHVTWDFGSHSPALEPQRRAAVVLSWSAAIAAAAAACVGDDQRIPDEDPRPWREMAVEAALGGIDREAFVRALRYANDCAGAANAAEVHGYGFGGE